MVLLPGRMIKTFAPTLYTSKQSKIQNQPLHADTQKADAFREPVSSAFVHNMRKPFMLAQIVLKAYAFALLLLLVVPALFELWGRLDPKIPKSVLIIGIAIPLLVLLFAISRCLSMDQVWAKVSADTVFIISAAVTIPMFTQSETGKYCGEYFWIPLWLIIMSGLGLVSLIAPTLYRMRNIEHADSLRRPKGRSSFASL